MNNNKINCVKCKYYFVTWNKTFPNGCKFFGFKSRLQPSDVVYESTGNSCEHFKAK